MANDDAFMDLEKGWICFDKIINFIFYFNKSNDQTSLNFFGFLTC